MACLFATDGSRQLKRWVVDPQHPDEELLAQAAEIVRRGGVVVFPTDTLYGLAADPENSEAVHLVFRLKHRHASEALPLVAGSLEQVEASGVSMTRLARRLAEKFWPGPVTMVMAAGRRLGPVADAAAGTVAVRVPAHDVARGLALAVGSLVTATSSNVSGRPPSSTADEAVSGLGPGVGGVVDAGPTRGGPPSTIVDVRGERPVLLRDGAVPFARVVAALEER